MTFLSRLFPQVRQMQRDTLRIKSEREEWRQRYVSLEARAGLSNGSRPLTYHRDGLATIHQAEFLEDPAFRRAYAAGVEFAGEDMQWEWRVRVSLWAAEQTRGLAGDFVECGERPGFITRAIIEQFGEAALSKTFHVLNISAGAGPPLKGNDCGHLPANVRSVCGPLSAALAQTNAASVALLAIALDSAVDEVEVGEHFWPRLAGGGVLLVNHGHGAGKEAHGQAWKSFAQSHQVPLLPLATGQALMIKTFA